MAENYEGGKLTFVHADDWVAVYEGDEQVLYQAHEIQMSDLLEFLNIQHEQIFSEQHERLDEQAFQYGRFPDTLEEVTRLMD